MTRLAIIAGQGNLPLQVAKAAVHQGYDVFIFPIDGQADAVFDGFACLLYTSPSPRDRQKSRMPSSA